MFHRFKENAIKSIMLAQQESKRLGHNYVSTEQIFLGVLGEGSCLASKALRSSGITLADARAEVEKQIGRGDGFVNVEIPFNESAKRVLEGSWDAAKSLNHNDITAEHLLLAILRKPSCGAAQVIESLGVSLSKLEEDLLNSL